MTAWHSKQRTFPVRFPRAVNTSSIARLCVHMVSPTDGRPELLDTALFATIIGSIKSPLQSIAHPSIPARASPSLATLSRWNGGKGRDG